MTDFLIEPVTAPTPDLSTGKARLAFLSAWLKANILPKPHKFWLGRWAKIRHKDELGVQEGQCSSAACAGGWATAIPEFKALGLRLEVRDDGWLGDDSLLRAGIRLGLRRDYSALTVFFGLEPGETAILFSPDYYESGPRTDLQTVLDRIDRLVESKLIWNEPLTPSSDTYLVPAPAPGVGRPARG